MKPLKRLHVHLRVEDLKKSSDFYSTVFGQGPTKQKDDYAAWVLDNPGVHFAITARGGESGMDHLGIQVENDEELETISRDLDESGERLYDQGSAECCYARSTKAWVKDPSGIAWETFKTIEHLETFGEKRKAACCTTNESSSGSCC